MISESQLQQQVADYLRLQYPDVLFHSDFGSGIKLTSGQAAKQKRQNGGRRAWPDMFIVAPRRWWRTHDLPMFTKGDNEYSEYLYKGKASTGLVYEANGLFLELKKDSERLLAVPRRRRMYHFKSKDGKEYKTNHLMEQADCLYDLRQRGYCAEFAVGFDEAKRIIDEYLGGK